MNRSDQALLIAGAQRDCSEPPVVGTGTDANGNHLFYHPPDCKGGCKGIGRVFLFDDSLRKSHIKNGAIGVTNDHSADCSCQGRGWLPDVLLSPEPCPNPGNILRDGEGMVVDVLHSEDCPGGCGGAGTVQEVRLQRLIAAAEGAGFVVQYLERSWLVGRIEWNHTGRARRLKYAPDLLTALVQAVEAK